VITTIFFWEWSYGATLKDFFYRADGSEIKLTFKFDQPVKWRDVSPDPYRLALSIEEAQNALPYAERPMNIGPLAKVIFRTQGDALTLWVELNQSTPYETYDEAGGRLVSLILKGPFAPQTRGENLYSFDFYDTEVRDALLALAKVAGVNIVVDDSVEGKITASFENLTFEQALGYILTTRGLGQVRLGKNIIIGERRKLEESFGLLTVKRFPLKYIDALRAKEAVGLLIDGDRVVADSVSKTLLVRGKEEEFQKVEEILKTIDLPTEFQVFYLSNNLYEEEAELQRIRELLRIIIPEEERVNYDFSKKAFLVRGTKEELEAVAQLLSNLDRRLPQIMIDVKLLEINREKVKDLGVSWSTAQDTPEGTVLKEGEISFGELTLGGTLERQNLVEVTIKALETKKWGRLVGNPRILTLSGKTALINVGESIPYRNLERDAEGNLIPGALQTIEVGVKLEVTPTLTQEGTVVVHAKPEVSTYSTRDYVLAGLKFQDPQKSTKSADTIARLRSGETMVIGGLIKSEDIENITRIPILSEIPILGNLFILRNKTHKETELIIFLTPYIIDM